MPYKMIINELLYSNDTNVRLALVKACRCKDINDYSMMLGKLAEDPEEIVRMETANVLIAGKNRGTRCKNILYGLAHDPSDKIRLTIAKSGIDPSLFVNDKNPAVRAAAVRTCKTCEDLLLFIKDPNINVIRAVIAMCKDQTDPMRNTILDRYIQENHTDVKKEIAMIGYRIHDLLQDNSGEVRNAAKKYLNIMVPARK